jgi:DNA-binding MarR family transcriptional regulator
MNDSVVEQSALPDAGVTHDEAAIVEAVAALLPRLGRGLLAGLARRGQAWGLSAGQTKAVLHVAADGPMTVGDVAARLGVSMPAASELVDRLVEAGLARRNDDPNDRRRVLVAATPEAARIGADLAALRRTQVSRALAMLEPAERPVLAKAVAALAAACEEDAGGAPPAAVVAAPPGAAPGGGSAAASPDVLVAAGAAPPVACPEPENVSVPIAKGTVRP